MNFGIIKNNFAEADFWLINKGSLAKLGLPIKEFKPYFTGIKCSELISPAYGYYYCVYLHQMGVWREYGQRSSINLKHLQIKDIRSVLNNAFTY